jgi:hypothetical protein
LGSGNDFLPDRGRICRERHSAPDRHFRRIHEVEWAYGYFRYSMIWRQAQVTCAFFCCILWFYSARLRDSTNAHCPGDSGTQGIRYPF